MKRKQLNRLQNLLSELWFKDLFPASLEVVTDGEDRIAILHPHNEAHMELLKQVQGTRVSGHTVEVVL